MSFSFRIDATVGAARAGVFSTPHGPVETPAFMPVGTLATVKALDPDDLVNMGASMILSNAYHLHLRPGDEVVREMGGLHRFMQWDRPILTDSGGFQVFSLEGLRTIEEQGVEFQSHIDGSRRFFTPEIVMQIERNLGADVIMQFDHVIPGQSDEVSARDASERSIRWLARCLAEVKRLEAGTGKYPQALFPIVQGGIHAHLRREAADAIQSMYASGPATGAGAGTGDGSLIGYFLRNLGGSAYFGINATYYNGSNAYVINAVNYTNYWATGTDVAPPSSSSRETDASTSSAPNTGPIPSRSTPIATAPPAPDSRGPISATFSCRTRYSGSASYRCTMYISCCRWRGERGRLYATATSSSGRETGSHAIGSRTLSHDVAFGRLKLFATISGLS